MLTRESEMIKDGNTTSLKEGCIDLEVVALFKTKEVDCSTFGHSSSKMLFPFSPEKSNMSSVGYEKLVSKS